MTATGIAGYHWLRSRSMAGTEAGRRILLACGMIASAYYVFLNVFVAQQWPAYSTFSQTVSELSAIGAPTRPLWVALVSVYTVLMVAFSFGVLASSAEMPGLRRAGQLLFCYAALGVVWPFAPMHLRDALAAGKGSLSDDMHIAIAMVTVALMFLTMLFGRVGFGPRFRRYSTLTILALIFFGALTALASPRLSRNLPTPWIGVWERINIGVFMLWIVVLAAALWRKANDVHRPEAPAT